MNYTQGFFLSPDLGQYGRIYMILMTWAIIWLKLVLKNLNQLITLWNIYVHVYYTVESSLFMGDQCGVRV